MRYQVSGKHIEIGDALRQHVVSGLGEVVAKYAERPTEAIVVFSRDAHEYVCEAVIHLSTGLTSQATARATEIYAAFGKCADKMEKQLRRYKRRLKNHHRERTQPVASFGGSSYILRVADEDEGDPTGAEDGLQPIIIAEMEHKIPSLSVGEAVMQMELAEAPLVVFRNEGQDRINVVYRRPDGNIGWIDPANMG
ncbi:MAG: ribosome-associated translation inhibitor RaiA [Rhodobacteraceae bacterium]|nr:ribosome-associated translation inhibitor RaiA [Paracoccaceae bacterium]